jgi:hypothetical protein
LEKIIKGNNMNIIRTFFPLALVIFLLIVLTFHNEFSSFGAGLSKYTMAVASAWFVDRFLIPEVKTSEILSQNPIAYAIFLFANIICAGLCFGNS